MNHEVAFGDASVMLGVCRTIIRRWEADGFIHCYQTPGEHRRITFSEIKRLLTDKSAENNAETDENLLLGGTKTAIYARVSSHDQKKKGDLDRQIAAVKSTMKPEELQLLK